MAERIIKPLSYPAWLLCLLPHFSLCETTHPYSSTTSTGFPYFLLICSPQPPSWSVPKPFPLSSGWLEPSHPLPMPPLLGLRSCCWWVLGGSHLINLTWSAGAQTFPEEPERCRCQSKTKGSRWAVTADIKITTTDSPFRVGALYS